MFSFSNLPQSIFKSIYFKGGIDIVIDKRTIAEVFSSYQ